MAPPGSQVAAHESCSPGVTWWWDGVAFQVLHPPAAFEGSDNDRSCALRVIGPGGSALLLADPEEAAESLLAGQAIAADVVLVPHHGSATSSSPALIAAVSARLAIASAGYGNRWGFPRADVVARWRAAGTTVYSTSGQGAVRVRVSAPSGPSRSRPSGATGYAGGAPGPAAEEPRATGAAARYHAAPCGKSSSPAAPSCGRSSCAR